jgi:energy-coupling factor transporter ATP-binding protein EcfA2
MDESFQRFAKYFDTYEAREEAFRNGVFSLIPRKHAGPKLFWMDFRGISLDELVKLIEQPIAYITSNPRDCLAFGTPWQVLTAAQMRAKNQKEADVPSVENVAGDFGGHENLFQPIRTLSGGETVKLAMAKAYLLAAFSQRLTVASPFSWLSRDNAFLFEKLYRHYADIGVPIELLALEGEDSTKTYDFSGTQCNTAFPLVGFSIVFQGVTIPLSSSLNPLQSQDTYAEVDDFEADLFSPCLIIGENGQGKSLIAKVVTGAISSRGLAKVTLKHEGGPARLLFQDVITQALLRSFDGIAASASGRYGKKPLELYDKIFQEYSANLQRMDDGPTEIELSGKGDFRSLLEIKTLLVAVRLCGRPSALILDEPDWGLCRDSAIALVLAVIKVAHELGTPILLISHKPWWLNLAKSTIHVQRTAKQVHKDQNYSFRIQLAS